MWYSRESMQKLAILLCLIVMAACSSSSGSDDGNKDAQVQPDYTNPQPDTTVQQDTPVFNFDFSGEDKTPTPDLAKPDLVVVPDLGGPDLAIDTSVQPDTNVVPDSATPDSGGDTGSLDVALDTADQSVQADLPQDTLPEDVVADVQQPDTVADQQLDSMDMTAVDQSTVDQTTSDSGSDVQSCVNDDVGVSVGTVKDATALTIGTDYNNLKFCSGGLSELEDWFKITPTETGQYTIQLDQLVSGSGSCYVAFVFTDPNVQESALALVEVDLLADKVTFTYDFTGGETYYINVFRASPCSLDKGNPVPGEYNLSVKPPCNQNSHCTDFNDERPFCTDGVCSECSKNQDCTGRNAGTFCVTGKVGSRKFCGCSVERGGGTLGCSKSLWGGLCLEHPSIPSAFCGCLGGDDCTGNPNGSFCNTSFAVCGCETTSDTCSSGTCQIATTHPTLGELLTCQ